MVYLDGPVWLDSINSVAFVESLKELLNKENNSLVLTTAKKINGLLHGILAEGELGKVPLSFIFDLMCKTVHSTGLSRKHLLSSVKSLG